MMPARFPIVMIILAAGLLSACRGDAVAPSAGGEATNVTDAVKILVAETGMVHIPQADLQEAGLSWPAWDAAHLHLSQGGEAIPYLLAEDTLIFYGQAADDRYTELRPYLLTTKPGLTMSETAVPPTGEAAVTTVPQTLHLEENALYLAQAFSADNSDVWFWQTLGHSQKATLDVHLPTVADRPATLRLALWGESHNPAVDLDHDFDLRWNGEKVTTVRWDGPIHHVSDVEIPVPLLQSGPNELVLDNEVEGASFLDIMQLNWLELNYTAPATAVNGYLSFHGVNGDVALSGFGERPFLFDVSDPRSPQLLTGWQYDDGAARLHVTADQHVVGAAASGWRAPAAITPLRQSNWDAATHQADLLIITTDELAPALAPLVAAREAQGITAVVVPIAEIYDTFGHGAASPESIVAFIRHATKNWQSPSPRYLLLVGDGTTDYRNYLGERPQNHIPALMVPVQYSGETVSDARLADVDGDKRPDLAVGRWPVDDVAAVESLVSRTLAYEAGTAAAQAFFAADGTEDQFAAISTRLEETSGLPADQTRLLNGPTAAEVTAVWNEGAWLTTYIGHGSVERWGKEDIFHPEAVGDLSAPNPPIVLQLTCLTGLFAHPQLTSLSETMLTHEEGPVLVVAATSLTLSGHQEPFAEALLRAMQDTAVTRMGDAFQQAKLSLDIENSNGLREISDTFTLFGDPSTLIVRPTP